MHANGLMCKYAKLEDLTVMQYDLNVHLNEWMYAARPTCKYNKVQDFTIMQYGLNVHLNEMNVCSWTKIQIN